MKIRMITLMAGPQGVREAGHVYEVPDGEAQQLFDGGYAEPLEAKAPAGPETEEMSVEGIERAVKPGKRGSKARHAEQSVETPSVEPEEAPDEESAS